MENIVNRVSHDYIESNLVYPLDKGYYCIAQLDESWVKEWVLHHVGNKAFLDIHNKYAITYKANNGKDIIIYKHDDIYWLIDK